MAREEVESVEEWAQREFDTGVAMKGWEELHSRALVNLEIVCDGMDIVTGLIPTIHCTNPRCTICTTLINTPNRL